MPSRSPALAVILATSLLFSGCGSDSSAAPPPEEDTVSIGVRVVSVQRGDIISVIDAVGTLQAVQEATISSRVPGRVDALPFAVGDCVDTGDLLVRLEQQEFHLAVRQAEAAVGSARARLAGARLVHKRVDELRAQHIASTERQDAAATQLAIGQAGVREANAALDIAEDQMANSVILAPFRGDVARLDVNVGERITPGQPLLHLVNLDTVEIDVSVSEKRIQAVTLGQSVRVRVDGFPTQKFAGVVHRLSPTVDPVSRTFVATVQLVNPDHRLRPGMFTRVEIQVGEHVDALVIHRAGLLELTGALWAVRVRDGRAERVEVTPGFRYGEHVEIQAGLDLGDQVVTEGAYGLGNGAALHIIADAG